MTPRKAIREQCLYCMCGSHVLVRECTSVDCQLHVYRLNRLPDGVKNRALLEINKFCLSCAGSPSSVARCNGHMLYDEDCCLHGFRKGTNPRRKGVGGRPPEEFFFGTRGPICPTESTILNGEGLG
ncbi:hypothetical protein FAK_24130 [Desulfoferula mesophila]|uniref:Uncharacterized protein n=1 Tax=Desulfoferula mesophila TaxID=3058419 RepID=A0AAU9F1S9_9BACT|nr:hypothetical protein FAK_24130 [Desulfoferula mesophilus]